MPSLGDMKARIADETKRPSLTTQIANAIDTAIQFYESRRFWFNEANATIPLSAGDPDYSLPSGFQALIYGWISDSGGYRCPMGEPLTWEEYQLNTNAVTPITGRPSRIAVMGELFYPWPVPDGTYNADLFHVASLAAFEDDNSENAWTNEAEPLIRARAKLILYREVIRDMSGIDAQASVDAEQTWLAQLKRRTRGRGKPVRAAPSQW